MTVRLLLVGSLLLCSSTVRADEKDARAIVLAGIKAVGTNPEEKVGRATWKEKGKFTGGGFMVDYTSDWAFQSPDKFRFVMGFEIGGMKVQLTVVASGDKVWESVMGMTQEEKGDKLQATLTEVYQFNVISLVPLVNEKDYRLSTMGEQDVNGKKTLVVKVARDRKPTVTLYFDKDSGLLVKSDVMVKDEFRGWKEVLSESYFGDYKDAGGRKVMTKLKVVRAGTTMLESTITDQQYPDKLDPKLFEKP